MENYKTLLFKNSLSAKKPKIAAEWHPTLNGELKPENFSFSSGHVVWWQCDKGHEWQAIIGNRSRNKHNCPYCSGRRTLIGFNDLQTWCKKENMNHLTEEWDDENNITNFTKGSNYKAKWRCRFCGHEWQASIVHRTHSGAGCPECAKKTIALKKAKKVLCIDTGEIFNSLSAASRTKNTAISYISQCCRGKQRTAGGYHWEYVDK